MYLKEGNHIWHTQMSPDGRENRTLFRVDWNNNWKELQKNKNKTQT
jgi:hypothetical protein